MKDMIGDYDAFIDRLNAGLGEAGIDPTELSMMDHVCYRVETNERYAQLVKEFSEQLWLLGETKVSGRTIATFEFADYLQSGGWTVPYLELPAPKEGSPYPEGLEHAEFVVIGSLDRFIERHANLSFNLKGMNKKINPEAGLKLNGISMKFHQQQLGAVVWIEQGFEG